MAVLELEPTSARLKPLLLYVHCYRLSHVVDDMETKALKNLRMGPLVSLLGLSVIPPVP